MTPGDQHLVDMRLAQHQLMLALVTFLALHDEADEVRLSAAVVDGRVSDVDVQWLLKGQQVGGFGA